jgi:uncharacterized ferritin-like protein (DUF455 family)
MKHASEPISPELLKTILFGGSLEHKLARSETLTELDSQSQVGNPFQTRTTQNELNNALVDLITPGRTGRLSLEFSTQKGKSQFPKKAELLVPSNRGRLLHYFANHELLAIETMAFVLLRFPEADPQFRAGVLRTLQDEQRHLSRYVKRMADFGVELGDFPLNLYFWNTLRQMKSPMDFVTQMSLTFEQANLDFALFYGNLFQTEIDDVETGELLKEVHEDEIKHVAHGMKWFSEWRNQNESEYESYQKLLPFPMTPRRARGTTVFAGASRSSAGMTADFIESIRIAGGSRGKVPNFFYFNGQAEIENGTPELPKHLKQKMDEMAPVILWLAHEEDVVELPAMPPLSYLSQFHAFKGELPEIVIETPPADRYAAFDEFKPWGFSQSAWKKLGELKSPVRSAPSFSIDLHSQKLFSKVFWRDEFAKIGLEPLVLAKGDPILKLGESLSSSSTDALSAEVLIKVDRSTSGRGHLRVPRELLATTEIQSKIAKIRARGDDVVIEPFLDKVNDFSLQYEIQGDGRITEFEPRFFRVDHLFQYHGSIIGRANNQPGFEASARLVEQELDQIRAHHKPVIQILKVLNYVGPFGIDALTYKTPSGDLKIAPVIEVNARYTMGRVAHEIERAVQSRKQKQGVFRMINARDLNDYSVNTFAELEFKLRTEFGENFVAVTPSTAKETWAFAVFSQDAVSRFLLEQFPRHLPIA